ncbi:DUF3265 domain-containing protein [Vibrio sp. S9_S30]|nr:DUF3265 domain-containing protein [Vibrio sp. S9_S30]
MQAKCFIAKRVFCLYRSNKSFKPTNNAWHFWFAVNLVFKAQCSSLFCALSAV